jgi:flavin-dependent dehydrogenase
MQTDVLILGAGPAGCAAAIRARRAGLQVILMERLAEPKISPGETLHPGIEPILAQLGVWKAIATEDFHRHRGIWVEWDGPRRFQPYGSDERGEWLGLQVDRARLHTILQKAATDLGAVLLKPLKPIAPLRQGDRIVGVQTSSGSIYARWLIDATGRKHWLADRLSLASQVHSPSVQVRFGWTELNDDTLQGQPLLSAAPWGWDWQAPLGNGRMAWARLRVTGKQPQSGHGFSYGVDLSWRIFPDCAGLGWFLLGDAASVLDPTSSHGVLRALMSGVLASHLIESVACGRLSESSAIDYYVQWMNEQFHRDVSALKELYARHRFGPQLCQPTGEKHWPAQSESMQ